MLCFIPQTSSLGFISFIALILQHPTPHTLLKLQPSDDRNSGIFETSTGLSEPHLPQAGCRSSFGSVSTLTSDGYHSQG
jgi:hypothetical protein